MAKVVRLKEGQASCSEPVKCPFFYFPPSDDPWCTLSERTVRCAQGRYERPSWCELPATVWAG